MCEYGLPPLSSHLLDITSLEIHGDKIPIPSGNVTELDWWNSRASKILLTVLEAVPKKLNPKD